MAKKQPKPLSLDEAARHVVTLPDLMQKASEAVTIIADAIVQLGQLSAAIDELKDSEAAYKRSIENLTADRQTAREDLNKVLEEKSQAEAQRDEAWTAAEKDATGILAEAEERATGIIRKAEQERNTADAEHAATHDQLVATRNAEIKALETRKEQLEEKAEAAEARLTTANRKREELRASL